MNERGFAAAPISDQVEAIRLQDWRGVPVCAVPFGRDQLEVACRVEVAGAGTRLPASWLRPDRLRVKTREAMTRTAGARRVAAGFAAAGGPAAAASAAENRLLGFQPSTARPTLRGN